MKYAVQLYISKMRTYIKISIAWYSLNWEEFGLGLSQSMIGWEKYLIFWKNRHFCMHTSNLKQLLIMNNLYQPWVIAARFQ